MHRALLAALAVSFAIAPAALAGPAAPSVPGEIAVPAGHKPFLVGHATGVQIYACDGAAWRLVARGAGTIDWLRLAVVTATGGDDGDRLAHTTYIQRINTTGGVAPAGPCADGARAEIPYTADYVFFKATG